MKDTPLSTVLYYRQITISFLISYKAELHIYFKSACLYQFSGEIKQKLIVQRSVIKSVNKLPTRFFSTYIASYQEKRGTKNKNLKPIVHHFGICQVNCETKIPSCHRLPIICANTNNSSKSVNQLAEIITSTAPTNPLAPNLTTEALSLLHTQDINCHLHSLARAVNRIAAPINQNNSCHNGMPRIPFNLKFLNSTIKDSYFETDLEAEIDGVEPIEVDHDTLEIHEHSLRDTSENNEYSSNDMMEINEHLLQISVTDQDVNDISSIAASLEITETEKALAAKRLRESSTISSIDGDRPPPKKAKKMMEPLEAVESRARPEKYVVKLVPDIEDIYLFTKEHGEIIHTSVKKLLLKIKDPEVKFDFCDFERGQYKFVCPNLTAKGWAMNVVPLLTGLWKDQKIKSIDCGIVPRLIQTKVIFEDRPLEVLDFFDDIELKNETIDTNHWRPFNKRKIQGDKTIVFFGVDANSVNNLKALGYKPYYANGRIRISIDDDKRNN